MEDKNIYQKLFEIKKVWIKLQRDTEWYWYSYATLSQIQEKLSEAMQEQWLIVIHSIVENKVKTEIFNTEWKDSVYSEIYMSDSTKPQDKGSEITYYRRYNLLSLLDLEVEDDDWQKAQWNKSQTKTENKELHTLTTKDVEQWNGKIYPWNSVYVEWEKKTISDEQVNKLKVHPKYVELPAK